jgi:uncharacterized protein
MINCHTHIFNVKCAPDRFFGPPIAKLVSYFPNQARGLSTLLGKIIFWSNTDMLERYGKMLAVGSERRQQDIFEMLLDQYAQYQNPRIVALPIDMDYMGAGEAVNDYITQINELRELKAVYPEKLIAFFSVDPRRPNVLGLLKDHVELYGFTGIKLYPALGFYPFDPRLLPIYEYAIQKNLPIMTHCDIGGIFYRGLRTNQHLAPRSFNGPARNYMAHRDLKPSKFKNLFSDPANFVEVLNTNGLQNLKLCLAHYGGREMVSSNIAAAPPTATNWYQTILAMITKFPHVYTDISYTLCHTDQAVVTPIVNAIRSNATRTKILFGTDYYMTVRVKNEPKLVNDFIIHYGITHPEMVQISVTNAKQYLSTTNFRP